MPADLPTNPRRGANEEPRHRQLDLDNGGANLLYILLTVNPCSSSAHLSTYDDSWTPQRPLLARLPSRQPLSQKQPIVPRRQGALRDTQKESSPFTLVVHSSPERFS
jgi:hypothetical protein